jgi:arginine decarboxylase
VREVLNYVQFSGQSLPELSRRDAETALREGKVTYEDLGRMIKFFEEGLNGYTYLEDVHEQ